MPFGGMLDDSALAFFVRRMLLLCMYVCPSNLDLLLLLDRLFVLLAKVPCNYLYYEPTYMHLSRRNVVEARNSFS